ncbi:hypothetical protein P7C73_g2165, partial [Tremellales sp. Uapishka_1]
MSLPTTPSQTTLPDLRSLNDPDSKEPFLAFSQDFTNDGRIDGPPSITLKIGESRPGGYLAFVLKTKTEPLKIFNIFNKELDSVTLPSASDGSDKRNEMIRLAQKYVPDYAVEVKKALASKLNELGSVSSQKTVAEDEVKSAIAKIEELCKTSVGVAQSGTTVFVGYSTHHTDASGHRIDERTVE